MHFEPIEAFCSVPRTPRSCRPRRIEPDTAGGVRSGAGTEFASYRDMATTLIIKRYVWLCIPCALFAAACDDTAAAVDEETREESRELKQEMKEAERDAEQAAAEAKQEIKEAGREIEAGAKEAARDVAQTVDAADKAVAEEIREEE